MSVVMGRGLGLSVVLCALTACGRSGDEDKTSGSPGTGGTNAPGTTGSSLGGQGGTNPQGQGGTNQQGQGGTMPQVLSGSSSQGSGGEVGGAGGTGTGGGAGFAGALADGGAAGATVACEDECEPCDEGYVYGECDSLCVCEPANSPDKPVHDDLLACDLDESCPPSVRTYNASMATWTDGICMLTAFRDRTPGRYHHTTILAQTGNYITDYTFLLGGNDEVLILRTTTNALAPGNAVLTYLPVWSCTLSSYEQLDACIAAGTDASGGQTICDGTEDWFDTCETAENPRCPGQ